MDLPLRIRDPRAHDAPHPVGAASLTEIAHRAKRVWGYPEDWIRLWRGGLTLTHDDLARFDVRVAWFREWEVGFLALGPVDDRTMELEHLWVVPECIGMGVGRRLFREAETRIRERGVAGLRIIADPNAAPFYQRMGATLTGESHPSEPAGRTLPVLAHRL